jgi:hypothetical protein
MQILTYKSAEEEKLMVGELTFLKLAEWSLLLFGG